MTDIRLVSAVRTALRVSAIVFDQEIEDLIEAAKDDLRLSGVSESCLDVPEPDPLIKRAIILYCKAEFGMDNPDSDKYMASFRSLEVHLALSSDYGSGESVS